MLCCGCVFLSYLLTVTLLLSSSNDLQATSVSAKCVGLAAVEDRRLWRQSGERSASKPTSKHLPLDRVGSITETKRRRPFPGANAPLDRLSVSSIDMKGKNRKEVESLRRRMSAPIDRIGVGRLPNRQG